MGVPVKNRTRGLTGNAVIDLIDEAERIKCARDVAAWRHTDRIGAVRIRTHACDGKPGRRVDLHEHAADARAVRRPADVAADTHGAQAGQREVHVGGRAPRREDDGRADDRRTDRDARDVVVGLVLIAERVCRERVIRVRGEVLRAVDTQRSR